jgi:hypothetical protein
VLAVAAIAIALGSVIDVVQIGEAGAQAVWSNPDAPSDQAR